MAQGFLARFALLLGLGAAWFAAPAVAVTLQDGDIIAMDDINDSVIQIDPVTGTKTTVSSGGNFRCLFGIAMEKSGDIIILDGCDDEVIRVDPATGSQTVVSSGGSFFEPSAVAVHVDGTIIVGDSGGVSGGAGALWAVDPVTGSQSNITLGGLLSPNCDPLILFDCRRIVDIEVRWDGAIFVAVREPLSIDDISNILQVDRISGAQLLVAQLTEEILTGLAIDLNGDIIVVSIRGDKVIRLDTTTGARTTLSSGGLISNPTSVAVEPDGNIVVGNQDGRILRIDGVTFVQSLITISAPVGRPGDLAVVGWPPRPSLIACAGFDNIGDTVFTSTLPRAIPLRAELTDSDGLAVTDVEIPSAPIFEVLFDPEPPVDPPADATGLLPPSSAGEAGNEFAYDAVAGRWGLNLHTLRLSHPGTYTIRMASSAPLEYAINPTCAASYVIE